MRVVTTDLAQEERARVDSELVEAVGQLAGADAGLDRLARQLRWREEADRLLLAEQQAAAALADSLMEQHYDPRYGKHRERMAAPRAEIAADRLGLADLPALAERLAGAIRAL